MNRAVFLDRDGTINEEIYNPKTGVPSAPRDPSQFRLLPRVGNAIKLLNDAGLKVVVITNQSGVARGYLTEEALRRVHKKLEDELSKKGASLDAIYYCPHHPDDECGCRKPKIGMLAQAAQDLNIDLKNSYMIGDKISDLKPGIKLGCKTILVLTGQGKDWKKDGEDPDYIASDLYIAAKWILNSMERIK